MSKFLSFTLWFAVFSLAFELPFVQIAGQGLKLWMIAGVLALFILLQKFIKNGFTFIKQSKILLFGSFFLLFSLIGLINSPQKIYSLKQVAILTVLLGLGIFFELYAKNRQRIVLSALATGLFFSSLVAIYQNIAFNHNWLNFEFMPARPNAFLPEPDWLGFYLVLGLIPFLIWVDKEREKSKLPHLLKRTCSFYAFITVIFIAIIISVARASWLALIAEIIILLGFRAWVKYQKSHRFLPSFKLKIRLFSIFLTVFLASYLLISLFQLSRFNLADRFRSIFFREHIITLAQNPVTGEKRKINLEEKDFYSQKGYTLLEDYATDENVVSRGARATSAIDLIKEHPLLGSGQGATLIATNFEHNANNLFLEWWVSAGLGGLLTFLGLLLFLTQKALLNLKKNPISASLILIGLVGFSIVNLFNASIFLAFAWFFLAFLFSHTKNLTK